MDLDYVIKRITEDDFGCEEHLEDEPVMARCLVESVDGSESFWVRVPDEKLIKLNLDEGSVTKRFW